MTVTKSHNTKKHSHNRARYLRDNVHAFRRSIVLLYIPALGYDAFDFRMNGVERIVGMRMNKGKRLTGGVGKLLLYHECSRQLVALVNIVVYDKPIHLRTQRDRTQHCGDYQLKYIILIAVVTLITPCKIILGSA